MDGQYQAKTPIKAFITDIKDVEYSKSSGKPGQSLYLRAENNEIAWVKLTGKFDPLTAADKGTTRDFLVWPFKPQDSPKTYLYCWIQRQSSQNTQQGSQQPAQATNSGTVGFTTQIAERIAIALEKIAANGQSFEQKYDLGKDPDFPNPPGGDCPI
jgi:hypothetical protein